MTDEPTQTTDEPTQTTDDPASPSTDEPTQTNDPIPSTEDLTVLFVDNFDSFTYNLVEYVSERAETEVVRNTVSLDEVRAVDPDAIVISPGPGHPANERDVGVSLEVLETISRDVPTLGVCMGMEAAVHAYGGEIGRAPEPIHGKASSVEHDGEGVFHGLDQGFRAGRYHSLAALSVPDCFSVTARTMDDDRLVMGVRHREFPIYGVQFHPESVLTAAGHDVIENFLAIAARSRDEAEDVPRSVTRSSS